MRSGADRPARRRPQVSDPTRGQPGHRAPAGRGTGLEKAEAGGGKRSLLLTGWDGSPKCNSAIETVLIAVSALRDIARY